MERMRSARSASARRGRYPGTRSGADPVYKVDRCGAVAARIWREDLKMTDAVLGIDVSENTFDTNLGAGTKARSKSFANSPAGWHPLIAWLGEHKIGQVHACLEATGRHGLGIALALHEAGHVVSIVNPAQIRDFARTTLGRNKTDQVDAVHIREYAELFKPRPWTVVVQFGIRAA